MNETDLIYKNSIKKAFSFKKSKVSKCLLENQNFDSSKLNTIVETYLSKLNFENDFKEPKKNNLKNVPMWIR